MSGYLGLLALLALVAAAAGTPRRLTRDEGIPGGDLGYIECKKATEEVWHLPYPGDCTKFIKCHISGNLSTIYTCDSPLHFDTNIQTCNWPEQAGCVGGGSGGSGSTTTQKPATDDGNGNEYDKFCGSATSEVWHLPFPGDCTKFIKCDILGKKYTVYTCDSPLHFNPSIQTCDWPANAGCSGGGGSGGSSSTSGSSVTPPPPGPGCPSSKETEETKESKSCEDGSDSSDSSSSSDSSDSSDESRGDGSSECGGNGNGNGSGNGNGICKDATAHRYHIPHPTDPTKFYKCDLNTGVAHLFDCPAGTIFYAAIQNCGWP